MLKNYLTSVFVGLVITTSVRAEESDDNLMKDFCAKSQLLAEEVSNFCGSIKQFRKDGETADLFASANTAGMRLTLDANFQLSGDSSLVELQGAMERIELSPGNPLNQMVEAFAVAKNQHYNYLPVGTSGNPLANLLLMTPGVDDRVKERVEFSVRQPIRALYKLGGSNAWDVSTEPNIQIVRRGELVDFKASGKTNDVSYSSSFTVDRSRKWAITAYDFSSGEGDSQIHQRAKIDIGDIEGLFPSKIVLESIGQGLQYCEVTEISRKACEDHFPELNDQYFARYQRDFTVLSDDLGKRKFIRDVMATPVNLMDTYANRMSPPRVLVRQRSWMMWGAFIVCLIVIVVVSVTKVLRFDFRVK